MTPLLVAMLLGPTPTPPEPPIQRVVIIDAGVLNVACSNCGGGSSGPLYIADAGVLNINPPSSLPLPTNAATSGKQDVANTSLGTISETLDSLNGKAPALVSGRVPVDGSGVTQPVSIAAMPSTPVTGTFWQATQPVSVAGTVVVTEGSATQWSCFVQAVTATTQCRAAPGAGQRLYVTSVACSNLVATAKGVDIVTGTGTNCATGIAALSSVFQMGTNALTTSPFLVSHTFGTPLVPAQNVAVCLRPTAATSFGCTLTGYTAP